MLLIIIDAGKYSYASELAFIKDSVEKDPQHNVLLKCEVGCSLLLEPLEGRTGETSHHEPKEATGKQPELERMSQREMQTRSDPSISKAEDWHL